MVNVGKCTSPMDAMGKGIPPNCPQKFRFRIYHSYRLIRKRKTGEKQWNTRTKKGNNKSWDLWGNANTYWDDSDLLEMSMSCSLFLCRGGFCRFASSDPWCVIVEKQQLPHCATEGAKKVDWKHGVSITTPKTAGHTSWGSVFDRYIF